MLLFHFFAGIISLFHHVYPFLINIKSYHVQFPGKFKGNGQTNITQAQYGEFGFLM